MEGGSMEYSEKLIESNRTLAGIQPKMRRGTRDYYYVSNCQEIDLYEVGRILSFIESIAQKHSLSILPIRINLGERIFSDKFSYIVLESLLHSLITKYKCRIETIFTCPHNIFNEGIQNSCLVHSGIDHNARQKFVSKYEKNISMTHYRKVLKKDSQPQEISLIAQEIDVFLKYNNIVDECRNTVGMIAAELADNASEHAGSECLIDVDVTKDYFKLGQVVNDDIYRGVNIVVMNYSDVLLGTLLHSKINGLSNEFLGKNERYKKLKEAVDFHSQFWNEQYTESDFFALASFQDKISGRNHSITGGKGLTELIKTLEIKSDSYFCYCLSGDRIIKLKKEYITYNQDKWIGFNTEQDFFTSLPDKNCIIKSPFFFPGTAYNLNFVLKQEE